MRIPVPPGIGYAVGYTEVYGADTDRPEHELWRTVLRQTGDDLFNPNEKIRADATRFFEGAGLLEVLTYAGIGTSYAPALRKQALAICQQSGRSRRRRGITYQGETRSCREWAKVTGLSMDTIVGRIRNGWGIERTLTVPLQATGRRPGRSSVAHSPDATLPASTGRSC